MKNISNSRLFVPIVMILFSLIVIFVSYRFIRFDKVILDVFPKDEKMERSAALTAGSSLAGKLILYVEVSDESDLEKSVGMIGTEVAKFEPGLKDGMPGAEDVAAITEYSRKASILLYPYEYLENPFSINEVDRRIKSKENFVETNPAFSAGDDFFLDPLMMGPDVLKLAYSASNGKYSPRYGGVVSANGKAYIKIFKAEFSPDDHAMTKKLFDLDGKITSIAGKNNFISFLYGSHLSHYDSYKSLKTDIVLIFILSAVIIFLMFLFIFRKPALLIYAAVPITVSFALTFVIIALFKRNYGGMAFIFGTTMAGIAVDYIMIYISKINVYTSLAVLRKKIGLSMFLGYITSVLVFLILLFSRIDSLQEIAFFGLVSVSASFFLSWFVLQNMIKPENFTVTVRSLNFDLANRYLFAAWCCIAAFFVAGVFFTRLEDDAMSLDKPQPFMEQRLKTISSNFNESTDSIFLCFSGRNRDDILGDSLEAFEAVYSADPSLSFLTPALFNPTGRIRKERTDFIKNNFNRDGFLYYLNKSNFDLKTFDPWLDNIKDIDSLVLPELPSYVKSGMDSMFVTYKDREYLLIQIPDRKKAEQISGILVKNRFPFFMVDTLSDNAKGLVKFERQSLVLLYISLTAVFLLLLMVYKNPLDSLLVVLPSLMGVISCFSISVFTGRGFNVMHLASSILIAGVGVDYGIYAVGMFRDGHNAEEMRSTIQSLMICALCTVAVFGAMSISSNKAVFSLGSSMLAGVIMAFLTAYCAVPFLMRKQSAYKIH
jgi:hypothetical protein